MEMEIQFYNRRHWCISANIQVALIFILAYSLLCLGSSPVAAQLTATKTSLSFSINNNAAGKSVTDDAPITWTIIFPVSSCAGSDASFKSTWQISVDGTSWTTVGQALESSSLLYLGSSPGYYMRVTLSEICKFTNAQGVSDASITTSTITSPFQHVTSNKND